MSYEEGYESEQQPYLTDEDISNMPEEQLQKLLEQMEDIQQEE